MVLGCDVSPGMLNKGRGFDCLVTCRKQIIATVYLFDLRQHFLNNYEAKGRFFWGLNNYVEVLVSHI